MKIRTLDRFCNMKEQIVDNMPLPMIGDEIEWVYTPNPKVVRRIWSNTEALLTIIVE